MDVKDSRLIISPTLFHQLFTFYDMIDNHGLVEKLFCWEVWHTSRLSRHSVEKITQSLDTAQ
jgi:hypothetical protein